MTISVFILYTFSLTGYLSNWLMIYTSSHKFGPHNYNIHYHVCLLLCLTGTYVRRCALY